MKQHPTPKKILEILQKNYELWNLKSQHSVLFHEKLTAWEVSIKARLTVLRGDPSKKPFISIVIPARNEEAYILPTLEGIAQQENILGVEVIVITNNCSRTDMTAQIARNCGALVYDYHYNSPKAKPIALARQMGLIFARGKLYMSTDADTIPMPHWLEHLSRPFLDNPDIGLATSHSHMYEWETDEKVRKNDSQRAFMRENFAWTGLTGIGHNTLFRRKDAEEIGGYSMKFYPGEDSEISFRLTVLQSKQAVFVKNKNAEVWISPRRVKQYGGDVFIANWLQIYTDEHGNQLDAREKFGK